MKSEGTRQDQEGFDNFFRKSIDVITVYEFNAALHTLVELGDANLIELVPAPQIGGAESCFSCRDNDTRLYWY